MSRLFAGFRVVLGRLRQGVSLEERGPGDGRERVVEQFVEAHLIKFSTNGTTVIEQRTRFLKMELVSMRLWIRSPAFIKYKCSESQKDSRSPC